MDSLKPPDIDRSLSVESDASHYTDAMSSFEDDDDDVDCYFNDMTKADAAPVSLHSLLYRDIENIVFLYGEHTVCVRTFETIDEIDVDLNIPLGFLDSQTAEAWRVNSSEPLIIRLHMSLSMYIESLNIPKIEVLQPSKKDKFGFGNQVRKFLEAFVSEHWANLYTEYKKLETDSTKAKKSISCPTDIGKETVEAEVEIVKDTDIAKLMEFGFDSNLARNALIIAQGNFAEACDLLQTNEERCSDLSPEIQAKIAENVAQSKPPRPKRQFSQPTILAQLKKMLPFKRSSSMIPSATDPAISSNYAMEDLNILPQSTLDGKNPKKVPSLDEGFLVQVFRYVRQRIPTVNEYCVVCDEPHVFQNGAMLKPTVCSRELCVFAFQTLGVMADAAEDIATGAEVVDLLLNMTAAASRSNRKTTIFDPYPTVVDPKDPSNLLFSPKNKSFDAVKQVIDMIPSMQEMTSMVKGLKQTLDQKDPSIYPLMQWIITSNRSHIVKLPTERQLDFMYTPHQFLLLSSPPAKEAAFHEAKTKYGSTFAFHGSSIENWHSIIRQGLVNASGTKLQVNGAAYGKGIYLSPHIATSMGYSRMGYGSHNLQKKNKAKETDGKPRFLQSHNITCIAICEVIKSPDLKKNNSIWVCPNEKNVCTRFFFVYEDGQVSDSSIDTQQDKYLSLIKKACGYKLTGVDS